jgi:hypothetical protein
VWVLNLRIALPAAEAMASTAGRFAMPDPFVDRPVTVQEAAAGMPLKQEFSVRHER